LKLLDANVCLRYLLQDNMEQANASKVLFDRLAAGEETVFVSEAVVAEVVYVLTSRRLYGVPRAEAAGKVAALLGPQAIRLHAKAVCLRGLEVFAERSFVDFADALLVAYAESEPESLVYSFDHGFDRVEGLTRVEPVAR
jgi:predicted nucleic acid-binding protein